MGPFLVVYLVVLVGVVLLTMHRPSPKPNNPAFRTIALAVAVVQLGFLALHWAKFEQVDVTVAVARTQVQPGVRLTDEHITTKQVDRGDAEHSVGSTAAAVGLVTTEALSTGETVRTTNAKPYVSVPVPRQATVDVPIPRRTDEERRDSIRVDVLVAPKETSDEPLVIEGALLDRRPPGAATLQMTSEDRTALLAISARSTITIQPSEDRHG